MNSKTLRLVLTSIGTVGVGVTSWLSIRCSRKADKETDRKKKLIAYAPAIGSGVATCGCIIASHRVSGKQIAALTATCGYLAANRDKIEQKIKDQFGEEKLNEIQKEAAVEAVKETKEREEKTEKKKHRNVSIEDSGHGNVHFVENYLGREFYSSLQHVEWAEKQMNYLFHKGESVCMNTFYELLDIKKTQSGWLFGWPANDDYYDYNLEIPIQFNNVLGEDEDGSLLYMIDINTHPIDCWMEL